MNVRLNNHRNDVRREDAVSQPDHHFNSHAKFTLIEQIKDLNKSKEEIRRILEDREDFWILKLKTLQPQNPDSGQRGSCERLGDVKRLCLTFHAQRPCLSLKSIPFPRTKTMADIKSHAPSPHITLDLGY